MIVVEIVTPNTNQVDSLRGYPATHASNVPGLTLCGKQCDAWRWNYDLTPQCITCRTCKKKFAAMNLELIDTLKARSEALNGVYYQGAGFHHELQTDIAMTRSLFEKATENRLDWETLMIALVRIETIEERITAAERSAKELQ